MTRMIIPDLIADFNAKYPDNNTQQITPAAARAAFQNQMDSAIPVIGFVAGTNGPGLSVPLTTTFQSIPPSFYTDALSGNPAFMESRPNPNGDIIVHTPIGRLFTNLDITFAVGVGIDIVITLGKNGTPELFRTIVSGQGAGNPVSGSFSWLFPTLANGDVYDIRIAAVAGTPTISLRGAALKGILFPQVAP